MPNVRKLVVNKNGQYTITLPKHFMLDMEAKSGDKFKFKYNGEDTLKLRWMGCDAN